MYCVFHKPPTTSFPKKNDSRSRGADFGMGGGCSFRTVKAPCSVLEIPVDAAVPELCKRGENRAKWCFVSVRASALEVRNFQCGLPSFCKLFDW